MKARPGRPRKSGKLSDYKNPKLVFIEKCSRDTYWYNSMVGELLVVCESEETDFGYNALGKMKNGKFANNGAYVKKEDVSYVCDVI